MANRDTPNGLRPIRYMDGSPYNGAHNLYLKRSDYAQAIAVGDPVSLQGTSAAAGTVVAGVDVEGMPSVTIYAVSTDVIGVVVGIYPNPNALGTNYSPASTAALLMVADDPDVVFEIQEDSVGANFAATDVGRHVDFVAYIAPDSTTGTSNVELDSSVASITTAETGSARLLRKVNRPDNAIGANCRWEVQLIEHTGRAGHAGV